MVVFLLIFGCPGALGATLHGTIYDLDLAVLNNVIVEVNTAPVQRFVSKDGSYSFSVDPGSYTIRAKYSPDNFTTLTSLDRIKVQQEGNYIFDLFLIPDLDEEKDILGDLDVDSIGALEEPVEVSYRRSILLGILLGAGFILFCIVVLSYYKRKKTSLEQRKTRIAAVQKRSRKERTLQPSERQSHSLTKPIKTKTAIQTPTAPAKVNAVRVTAEPQPKQLSVELSSAAPKILEPEKTEEYQLSAFQSVDGDLRAILEFIKREGGRTTQKDLRREIPYSEAKISLMISELEHKKLVKRIRKGRGNIIILNE